MTLMKTRWLVYIAALLGFLNLGSYRAYALLEVGVGVQIHTVTEFNEPLGGVGAWVEHRSYGRCWHPAHVEATWRPYCDGSWVWTDSGWYWQSDEPWAWACYHYGRWVYDPDSGWLWLPDVEWAPAWVYWRSGGDHIGWAPCPPHGRSVADAQFVFVETRHFNQRIRPTTVIINNTTIIHNTRLITKTSRSTRNIQGVGREKVIINNGPGVKVVQKAVGKKFQPEPIHEVAARAHIPERVQQRVLSPVPSEPRHNQPPVQPQPTYRQPEHVAPQPPPQRPAEPRHEGGGPDRSNDRDNGNGGSDRGPGHGNDKDHH